MAITELYSDYFQKSKTFLLPLLGLKKNEMTPGFMTFIAWEEGRYEPMDHRLVVVKNGDHNSPEYRKYEKVYLLSSPHFETFIPVDDVTVAYVFNMEKYQDDWKNFLAGRYSRLSITLKDRIKNYFGEKTVEWEYIKSFLYPEKYFEQYAYLLNVNVDLLRQVGELCDPYNLEHETFKVIHIAQEVEVENQYL